MRMNKQAKASSSYIRAIDTCKTNKKNWISFAHACEKFALEKSSEKELWNC